MREVTTKTLKPLQIRFDDYGAGDDNEFKYELIVLMTGSMRELKLAARNAIELGGADNLKRAIHKSKSTLTLINDDELMDAVNDLSHAMAQPESTGGHISEVLARFNIVCDSVIDSLEQTSSSFRSKF